jgi:hypothetical protein
MKTRLFLPVLMLEIIVSSSQYCHAADTISVAAFGLKPDSRENAVLYVQKALDSCRSGHNVVLVFPKGRYDFWPQHCIERFYPESNTTNRGLKRLAILIEGQEGLTVEGSGSEFVFHDRMQPFTIDHSDRIAIRNLSIDWDIPLTAQAEVMKTGDGFIDLRINAYESPYIIENGRLVFIGEGWKSEMGGVMEFERETRRVAYRTGDQGSIRYSGNYRAEGLDKGIVRLHAAYQRQPAEGNLLVVRHSERDHAGIFITDSENVLAEDVEMYHCCGLGILSQYSGNLCFRRVNCVPNPKKYRILAGHDDGFHYSNCRGLIEVDDCTFHALMDDPINVHGTSIRVMERIGNNALRCKFMHAQSAGMVWARAGETVGFIRGETMETIARGKVKSYTQVGDDLFDIVFEEPTPKTITFKDALENLDWTPEVHIHDSRFLSCRARGLLLSSPAKTVVENNIFESSGSAILIAGDANYWFESGAVNDVLIQGNVFRSPCLTSMYQFCEAVISICPEIPKPVNTALFHRNIRIVGNEFQMFDYPALYAFSVDGLTFADNRLIRSYDFEPFHSRKDGLTFKNCRKITISGNYEEGGILGTTIKLIDTPAKECRTDAKSPFKQIR